MANNPVEYPFPAKVHVASCVTIRLNDTNYLLWKTQVESLLSSQKLLGFVNGRYPEPATTVEQRVGEEVHQVPNPAHESWFCTDQLVKSWIFGTLSDEALGSVCSLATAHEVWSALANTYNRSSIGREFDLKRKLQLLTKQGKSFSTYVREYTSVCDQLSSIGKPVDESMKICGFLNGLGREYDPITTVVQSSMSRLPTPTFTDVVFDVQGFDSRLQAYQTTDVNPQMAFNTQVQQSQEAYQAGYQSNRGRGYNNRGGSNRGRGGFSSRGRGFHQQNGPSGGSNARPVCQICGRVGHIALKCWNRFDNNYQPTEVPQALAALQLSDLSGREWIPDSGASAHITSATTGLQNTAQYQGLESVMVADGNYAPITHVGSTNLPVNTGSIPLNEVLVCPSVQKSLLSVSKLCEDYPCGVFFDAKKVCILDLQTMKVLTQGPRRNGLYVLENQEFKTFYSNRQQGADDFTWHHRLGHASSKVLQHLSSSKAIVLNKNNLPVVCEPCQMGKSFCLPFAVSESVSIEPLVKIHCDLWGPSPVMSLQGFKFYAVFVDDHSRYSWFYPLKFKSDFYEVFIRFQKYVENQFNKKIKVFQSDGGGEFMSSRLRVHFHKCGIFHQKSCPYTPAQNGLA